jgi:heterodisulfide reductase subunit C
LDFGYTINQSAKIDLDEASNELAGLIIKHEPSFITCIGCGTCMSTCSAGRFVDFNLRKIQLTILRGQAKKIRENMEKCMLCGKCQMLCPRGINTRNVVLAIHRYSNTQD